MITRRIEANLITALEDNPAVALLGPRQVGKTTLAMKIASMRPSIYLDLESASDKAKLADPESYLIEHEDRLVILDEVHRVPELFQNLRGLIDRGRRRGKRTGRFLLLGSASIDLMRQSGESLAGRIAYLELGPFDALEVMPSQMDQLWLQGGFPPSFLARTENVSFKWRQDFIRTYLERDIPQFGPRIPSELLRRFWTMLAHNQTSLLNAAALARGLGVDGKTITRYLDLLVDLLLVQRLPAWHKNVGKRLVRAPKVLIRDPGLVHALLGIADREQLLGHPIVGHSWEGFVIETILQYVPYGTEASFYRTSAGAEIDLVLLFPGGSLWALEIKRSSAPKLEKGFYLACIDLKTQKRFVVYPGNERFPLTNETEAIGLLALVNLIQQKEQKE